MITDRLRNALHRYNNRSKHIWTTLKNRLNVSGDRGSERETGLTLIELLVVVVILGIIAMFAVPNVLGAISTAKVNATESNLSTLQTALERYAADNGKYPASLSLLDAKSDGNGPYLSTGFPINDGWGNPIYYGRTVNKHGYILVSGDGVPISGVAVTASTQYVWAAGGTNSGVGIGETPTVATSTSGIPSTVVTDFSTVTLVDN